VSYAHAREAVKNRLLLHLAPLLTGGLVSTWTDREIPPGADWRNENQDAIARADGVIFIVCADFVASTFCRDKELPAFLKRRREDGFLLQALKHLGVEPEQTSSDHDLGRRLAETAAAAPTVLLLDGLEPLQEEAPDPGANLDRELVSPRSHGPPWECSPRRSGLRVYEWVVMVLQSPDLSKGTGTISSCRRARIRR
jgi:hypothetical protein